MCLCVCHEKRSLSPSKLSAGGQLWPSDDDDDDVSDFVDGDMPSP